MKSLFKNIIIGGCFILGSMVMTSCEEYLDIAPEAVIAPDEPFKNFRNFQGFTEELYNCVVNFTNNYWTNSWNWGDDEITCIARNMHFIHRVDEGNFWGWQAEHDGWGAGWMDQGQNFRTGNHEGGRRAFRDLWTASWYGIRKANLGLANLDKMTDATQEERDLIEGQLLFFRGWFHHRLMEYFGGLPYVNRLLPAGELLRAPRLSYHETADLAALDFRRAADLLPFNWDDTQAGSATLGHNDLRINKIMALGYLGKNYLWAASPLMNHVSGGTAGSLGYNTEYARKAAEAFAELLEYAGTRSHHRLISFDSIHNNFYTTGQGWALPGAQEAIFRAPYFSAHRSTWRTAQQYFPEAVSEGYLVFVPTANYVEFYGMANGLPLDHPESGFDPNYPWRNRDPRFYKDIVFDGVRFVQSTEAAAAAHQFANLHTGGNHRVISGGSRTGFMNRKFVPLTANRWDGGYQFGANLHIQIPYMRLADIYLMYAEAAAVAFGSPQGQVPGFNLTAVDAINVIRDRARAGRVHASFTGSLDAFLPELRRERAVELAFEAHRFNDLRRWKLLIHYPYTEKTGIEFDRAVSFNPADPQNNRVENLREVTLVSRPFDERHWWLPFKVRDVSIYPEFYQNPGW